MFLCWIAKCLLVYLRDVYKPLQFLIDFSELPHKKINQELTPGTIKYGMQY